MKAQVLRKYDPEMKEAVWVTGEELPNPKIEKASDVIVKIGAAGVCRTDLHIIEGVWKHITDQNNDLLPMVMGHATTRTRAASPPCHLFWAACQASYTALPQA